MTDSPDPSSVPVPRYYPELLSVLETLPPAQQEVAMVAAMELLVPDITDYLTSLDRAADVGQVTRAIAVGERWTRGEATHAELVRSIDELGALVTDADAGMFRSPRGCKGLWGVLSLLAELDTVDPGERAQYVAPALFLTLLRTDLQADTEAWWQRVQDRLAVQRAVISDMEPAHRDRGTEPAPKHRVIDRFRLYAWTLDDLAATGVLEFIGAFTMNNIEMRSAVEYLRSLGVRRFIADLQQAKYFTDLGDGTLIILANDIGEAGDLWVTVAPHPKVKVVFDMLGVTPILHVVPDMDAARAAVRAHIAEHDNGPTTDAGASAV